MVTRKGVAAFLSLGVKIQVIEGGKELFKGWSFRNSPDMHSFTDPRYTVRLTRAIAAGK